MILWRERAAARRPWDFRQYYSWIRQLYRRSIHGFLYTDAIFTPLDDPLATGVSGSFANAIYGNTIVGQSFDSSNIEHGYLFDGSTYMTLDDPLGAQGTSATGISGSDIVGFYTDSTGITHGFEATVPEPSSIAPAGDGSFRAVVPAKQQACTILPIP